ncbi:MAG: Trypsin [Chromatiales bacterium USCg_Taylor]|nr:MAG: Trypsin [Chromatiales bacterium USCg_Taylor]
MAINKTSLITLIRRLPFGVVAAALAFPASSFERDPIEVAPGVYMLSVDELAPTDRTTPWPGGDAEDRSSRIVGGTETTITSWPWQTGIVIRPSVAPGTGFERQFCGGSLVTPTFVITAAHCLFDNPSGSFIDPLLFSVITGRTTLSSSEGQEIDFDTYFVPAFVSATDVIPLFNPDDFDFDFVIVRLSAPSSSPTVQIAGPDERATWAVGQPAFVTGWGATAEGSATTDGLRAGRVAIVDDGTCINNYAAAGVIVHAEAMVCAGLPQGGVDSCQGDSGGPIVVPISGGGFRLVGDTSFGIGCARPGFPGVYARLADDLFRSIIENFIFAETGINVIGSGAQPLTPPLTSITKGPKKKTFGKRARVTFLASEPASSFVCKLDRKPERPCVSPFSVRVKPGRHRLSVTAINFIGERGLPARRRWTVLP